MRGRAVCSLQLLNDHSIAGAVVDPSGARARPELSADAARAARCCFCSHSLRQREASSLVVGARDTSDARHGAVPRARGRHPEDAPPETCARVVVVVVVVPPRRRLSRGRAEATHLGVDGRRGGERRRRHRGAAVEVRARGLVLSAQPSFLNAYAADWQASLESDRVDQTTLKPYHCSKRLIPTDSTLIECMPQNSLSPLLKLMIVCLRASEASGQPSAQITPQVIDLRVSLQPAWSVSTSLVSRTTPSMSPTGFFSQTPKVEVPAP